MFMLVLAPDGNLFLSYNDRNRVLWMPSGNGNLVGSRLTMNLDGNLVFYDEDNRVLWQSNTTNHGEYLSVQDDGTLGIFDANKNRVWSSRFEQGI